MIYILYKLAELYYKTAADQHQETEETYIMELEKLYYITQFKIDA